MKPEIVVVVVLYQQLFSQSPTYEPLSKALSEKHIQLVIYDNSPQRQQNELFEKENTIYYHDPQNPGLAAAYNYALSQANERTRCIVTLDQDTRLVDDYFEILRKVAFTDECVAAVPMIFSGGRQVSPVYSNHYINRTAQAVEVDGTTAERIMAINSGVAWSVKFLKKIGGFNPAFSLDFLDHWLFWKVDQLEKTVEILPVRMEHDLSVLDYEKVSSNRYRSILQAENRFYHEYDQRHLSSHRRQLLLRTAKQFLTVKNRHIWRMTLRSYVKNWKV